MIYILTTFQIDCQSGCESYGREAVLVAYWKMAYLPPVVLASHQKVVENESKITLFVSDDGKAIFIVNQP